MADNELVLKDNEQENDRQVNKEAEIPKPIIEPDIRVLIARDRMEASLEVTLPPGCRPLEMDELFEKINKSGIVFGINQENVKRAYQYPGSSVVCASGQKPVDGNHATIKYYINAENKGRPEEKADGSVDFKNLNFFTVVQKGDLLAEKIPATPSIAGMDVLGNEINGKPGKDIAPPVGKNVQLVDGTSLFAGISGQLMIANNKINVVPVLEIKEDVDVSTGNIEFIGDVIIRGSVQPGFVVTAEGNVEIYGSVSGGTVEGKNVIIKMGIQGMHRGHIKATETVVAKFIENATVYAGTDIMVTDVVLHSRISAGKKVIVEGKRGLIVGGTIMAGELIRAKSVGTQMATITALEVGVNPMLREEYQQIKGEVKKVNLSVEKTQKALSILRAMDQSTMPPDKREMLLKLTKAQFHLAGQGETMRKRIAAIEEELDGLRNGHIKVSDTLFPGVKVVIGTLLKPISEIHKFISLYAEGGEIKSGTFK